MPESIEKVVKILLVEDNPADVKLMEILLKKCRFGVQMSLARDGEEALNVLRRSGSAEKGGEPDFVLLDLNLPKIDGHEVLREIKTDPALKHIPVVILTGSNNGLDIDLALKNHADGYLVKGAEMSDQAALIKRIEDFWSKIQGETA